MSSLKQYLADKYLSAPTDPRKKKKKKKQPKHATTTIIDEEEMLNAGPKSDSDQDVLAQALEEGNVTVDKWTSKTWVNVGEAEGRRRRSPSLSPSLGNRRSRESPSPSPVRGRQPNFVENEVEERVGGRARKSPSPSPSNHRSPSPPTRRSPSSSPHPRSPIMEDGSKAGLQTKHTRQKQKPLPTGPPPTQSTVYRDRFGRKLDIETEKSMYEAQLKEKEAQKQVQSEWGGGVVQQEEAEALQRALAEEKDRAFAVYKEDTEWNDKMKAKTHWGDPMAFMTKKKTKKKVVYKGAWAPNRFSIPPGYRWDGVDRSNGFEAKYFQAQNKRQFTQSEAYKWSTEDM